MWFILSAAYVGWLFYWSFYKRQIPAIMHKFYYSQRKFKEADAAQPNALGAVNFLIVALLFVAYLGLLQPFFERAGYWVGYSFGLWLFTAIPVMKTFTRVFAHYNVTVREEEERQELRKAYGTKDFANINDAAQAIRSATSNGKPVGIHIGEGLHWYDKGHMLTVGGSGQGKGVNLILPAILSDSFTLGGISLVCLDPKGENAAIAAPYLKRCGYDVHVLNPAGIREIEHLGNSRFNPLDLIDKNDNSANRLYDLIADALHNRRGEGNGAFFDNRARQYISLYISYAQHSGQGDLATVAKWLVMSGDTRNELLTEMATDTTFESADLAKGILDRLKAPDHRTEDNVFVTVEEAANILRDRNIASSLSGSDFDLRDVAARPTAIFLCVPFEDLRYYSPWVRIVFNFLLRTLTKYYNQDRKVLVLLDEFAQLSYMDEVPRASAVLRGYNVTLWPIVQDLGQLRSIYGDKWETFISNSVIKHWLGTGTDNTTAEYISKRMPQTLQFLGNNPDGSPKVDKVPLLSANQVINFPYMVCEISGLDRPAKFEKVPYWNLPFSKNNASPNPFY